MYRWLADWICCYVLRQHVLPFQITHAAGHLHNKIMAEGEERILWWTRQIWAAWMEMKISSMSGPPPCPRRTGCYQEAPAAADPYGAAWGGRWRGAWGRPKTTARVLWRPRGEEVRTRWRRRRRREEAAAVRKASARCSGDRISRRRLCRRHPGGGDWLEMRKRRRKLGQHETSEAESQA
jgi:hypothetical protein